MKIDDGKTKTDVAMEFVTSISVPIIPDADEYMAKRPSGQIYTIQMPSESFAPKGCILPFTEENGRIIEKWMAKHCVAERGDQLIVHLEDKGCVRFGVRRGQNN